jgi:predicted RNase H-like nuclease (RuvC/YqgF family)
MNNTKLYHKAANLSADVHSITDDLINEIEHLELIVEHKNEIIEELSDEIEQLRQQLDEDMYNEIRDRESHE